MSGRKRERRARERGDEERTNSGDSDDGSELSGLSVDLDGVVKVLRRKKERQVRRTLEEREAGWMSQRKKSSRGRGRAKN